MKTIFERPRADGATDVVTGPSESVRTSDVGLERDLLRDAGPRIPSVSEPVVVRHYTELSKTNFGVDDGFYPLGSCTMKYNPRINEVLAGLPGFTDLHPLAEPGLAQGTLHLLCELSDLLAGIAGLSAVSLQPVAGAHGELTGLLLFKRYFEERGSAGRTRILLPDSAHGTNPASAAMAGFSVEEVPSNDRGMVDVDALRSTLDETVAGIMLTVPNTLGIFEERILEITEAVHAAGGLCYFDGANLNAFLGRVRPGDMGADVFHFNLHKTLSTPHGGGGPGSGPIAVSDSLVEYLPVPRIARVDDRYDLDWDHPRSIGSVQSFYGNVLVAVKAYAYLLRLGDQGLREVSENAVLNANYLRSELKRSFELPYEGLCKHEFVLSAKRLPNEITALDVAKRLIDLGVHPPTVYFPLIVREALMIEPTETETKESLDRFVEAMEQIASEALTDPDVLRTAPHAAPVRRLDQTRAARDPILTFRFDESL